MAVGFEAIAEKKEPLPVVLSIKEISRNGEIRIKFNQKLKVPAFISKTPEEPLVNITGR